MQQSVKKKKKCWEVSEVDWDQSRHKYGRLWSSQKRFLVIVGGFGPSVETLLCLTKVHIVGKRAQPPIYSLIYDFSRTLPRICYFLPDSIFNFVAAVSLNSEFLGHLREVIE